MAYNSPRDPAKLSATPELFVMTVDIMPDPVTIVRADTMPPLPATLDWRQDTADMIALARAIHPTPRDRASAHLLPQLVARLSTAQRRELAGGKEIAVPVASLPAKLHREATDYITLACTGMGNTLIQFGSQGVIGYNDFNLVILSGSDRLLGIDNLAAPGRPHSYF